jgi:hypothetical protein
MHFRLYMFIHACFAWHVSACMLGHTFLPCMLVITKENMYGLTCMLDKAFWAEHAWTCMLAMHGWPVFSLASGVDVVSKGLYENRIRSTHLAADEHEHYAMHTPVSYRQIHPVLLRATSLGHECQVAHVRRCMFSHPQGETQTLCLPLN